MTYDMDQAQRRDIETALGRISLEVDSENTSDNPYLHIPSTFVGNNWFQQGEKIVKLNITEDDSLSFVVSALTNLRQKNITNVIVSFDYEVDNVNVNYPLLVNISFASADLTSYKSCETILTTQGHIDVDCSLFDFSSDIVNNAITEQGFTIGLNFNGNLSNATAKINNVTFGFKYTNLLQAEIDAVKNRLGDLNPNIEIVTSWNETLSNDKVPSEKLTKESIDVKADSVHSHIVTDVEGLQSSLDSKQAKLVSGTNIKTINNNSLLGSGNITIQGGSSVDIVTSWSSTLSDSKVPSEKLTKDSLDGKANSSHTHTKSQITDFPVLSSVATTGSYIDLSNKPTIPSKISDLTNDSDFIETSSTTGLIKNDGTIDTTQYLSSLPSHNHDDRYYTESEVDTALNGKQDALVSGTNIKTINNNSLLGSGNITIQGGGGSVDIATSWGNPTSDSKVPSEKLTKDSLDGKADSVHSHGGIASDGKWNGTGGRGFLIVDNTTKDISAVQYVNANVISDNQTFTNITPLINFQSEINTAIDTALGDKQDTLISGTNIKTINNQDILGSGNINIGSSSTIIHYFLSSSDYNPTIDTAFTITCKVTNENGGARVGETVELFNNGVSVGTATTDYTGNATWNVTLSDWDNHHFNVEIATLDLMANGWKTVVNETNYLCQVNGKTVFFYVRIGTSLSHPTTFTAFGGGAKVPSGYRPRASVTENAYSNYNILVSVKANGTVERRSMTGSAITSTLYATFYWII